MWFILLLLASSNDKSSAERKKEDEDEFLKAKILASMPSIPLDAEDLEKLEVEFDKRRKFKIRMMYYLIISSFLSILTMWLFGIGT